ncbi:MAG: hypothetical protein E7J22_13945 [Clostridium perfringens]|nr:hypothetical protein [Clostridium perfringens]
MDFDKVLHIATFAGRIILESGGETYRVEETMELWFLFMMRIIIQLL